MLHMRKTSITAYQPLEAARLFGDAVVADGFWGTAGYRGSGNQHSEQPIRGQHGVICDPTRALSASGMDA